MALRFQNKSDDVDREVEEPKMGLGCLFLGFLGIVVVGAFYFALDVFISGNSVNRAYRDMGWFAAFVFVVVIMERKVVPKYREFRVRTKEILGTVTEIEKAVIASKRDHAESLERFTALEVKLEEMQRELERRIASTR